MQETLATQYLKGKAPAIDVNFDGKWTLPSADQVPEFTTDKMVMKTYIRGVFRAIFQREALLDPRKPGSALTLLVDMNPTLMPDKDLLPWSTLVPMLAKLGVCILDWPWEMRTPGSGLPGDNGIEACDTDEMRALYDACRARPIHLKFVHAMRVSRVTSEAYKSDVTGMPAMFPLIRTTPLGVDAHPDFQGQPIILYNNGVRQGPHPNDVRNWVTDRAARLLQATGKTGKKKKKADPGVVQDMELAKTEAKPKAPRRRKAAKSKDEAIDSDMDSDFDSKEVVAPAVAHAVAQVAKPIAKSIVKPAAKLKNVPVLVRHSGKPSTNKRAEKTYEENFEDATSSETEPGSAGQDRGKLDEPELEWQPTGTGNYSAWGDEGDLYDGPLDPALAAVQIRLSTATSQVLPEISAAEQQSSAHEQQGDLSKEGNVQERHDNTAEQQGDAQEQRGDTHEQQGNAPKQGGVPEDDARSSDEPLTSDSKPEGRGRGHATRELAVTATPTTQVKVLPSPHAPEQVNTRATRRSATTKRPHDGNDTSCAAPSPLSTDCDARRFRG